MSENEIIHVFEHSKLISDHFTLEAVTAAYVAALAALREKQERENPEPLTLEELRGMDGKPVWVQDLLIRQCSAWHFAMKHDGQIWLFDAVALARRIVGYNATTGENYGKT